MYIHRYIDMYIHIMLVSLFIVSWFFPRHIKPKIKYKLQGFRNHYFNPLDEDI